MIYYLDFEANGITQAQEIISIGAIAETGETFYSLVRPHAKLDYRIKELTGILQETIEMAPTIESVMEKFYRWMIKNQKDCREPVKFYVYGNCDCDFVRTSMNITEDQITKLRLYNIELNMIDISKRIAAKFHRGSISLRSAYLTMRLSSNDTIKQYHNALEDAAMLKYVWENLDYYEMPENTIPVKVPRASFKNYSKSIKVTKTLIGCAKTRRRKSIKQCPQIMDEKYNIPIIAKKVVTPRKVIKFDNMRQAMVLVHNKKFNSGTEKLEALETIYKAIQTGEAVNGWYFYKE